MFHWDFNVPRGSGTFLAKVFLATFFLLYITVEVLSPNVISNLSGIILPGTRVWLSGGAFSESSVSLFAGSGWDWALYWMLSSGSLSWSQSHIISLGSAGCRRVSWSEANLFICLYESRLFDGLVIMFDSSVFGGLPKCASNGFIFVVAFGISLMDSIILATIVARSDVDIMGHVPWLLFVV